LLVETTTGHCKALIGPWLRDGIRWKSPDLTSSGLMPGNLKICVYADVGIMQSVLAWRHDAERYREEHRRSNRGGNEAATSGAALQPRQFALEPRT